MRITTSLDIGHLFLATMNKCTELRKYAFPDPTSLDFFFLFWWVVPPLKIFDTYFNTLYTMQSNVIQRTNEEN